VSIKNNSDKLPITVISGYLGSGKTSLLLHLLKCKEQRRIGIIVNDVAEVNVDAKIIEKSPYFTEEDQLIPLQAGSISSDLSEELIEAVANLAKSQRVDYILVESSGIAQPDLIANYLSQGTTRQQEPLNQFCYMDTMVSVVDAYRLLQQVIPENGKFNEEFQNSNQLIMHQIEFCDVVLFNKIDLIQEKEKQYLSALIKSINPHVAIIESTYCQVPVRKVMDTQLFNQQKAFDYFEHNPVIAQQENSEFTVQTFVYRRRAPFHPERFDAWLNHWPKEVIRCKGVVWFGTQPENVINISQAGRAMDITHSGYWIATLKNWEIEKMKTIRQHLTDIWDDYYGDRMIELVFIGTNLNQQKMIHELDECLMKEEETIVGLKDPFQPQVDK
jgi:G3E family GTPase